MKLIAKLLLFVFLFVVSIFTFTGNSYAAISHTINPTPIDENTPTVTVEFQNLVGGTEYYIGSLGKTDVGGSGKTLVKQAAPSSGKLSITVCGETSTGLKTGCGDGDFFHGGNTYKVRLGKGTGGDGIDWLDEASFYVNTFIPNITLGPNPPSKTAPLVITITGSRRPINRGDRNKYTFELSGNASDGTKIKTSNPSDLPVPPSGTGTQSFGPLTQNGDYTLKTKYSGTVLKTFTIKITDTGVSVDSGGGGGGVNTTPGVNLCADTPGGVATKCKTALGDIPVNAEALTQKVLSIALGLAGGIALIFMVYGSIKILVSSGDPKKIGDGRDIIVAAISGLLFLILSVLILKFIGIAVLPTNPFG